MITIQVTTIIMTGPVGTRDPSELSIVPTMPAAAPNNADNKVITDKRSVHCLAATAGEMSIALINTTPTLCKPMTMDNTTSPVKKTSNSFTENPRLAAYS